MLSANALRTWPVLSVEETEQLGADIVARCETCGGPATLGEYGDDDDLVMWWHEPGCPGYGRYEEEPPGS